MSLIRKVVVPLVAGVRPQVFGINDDALSPWVDASQFEALMALAMAGDVDGDEVVVSFEQAKPDASGDPDTGTAKVVSGWGSTTLNAAGEYAQLDLGLEHLDINNGFKFIRMKLLSGADSGPTVTGPVASGAVFGVSPRHTDDVTVTDPTDETVAAGPAPAP